MNDLFCIPCWESRRPLLVQVPVSPPAAVAPIADAAARKRARLRSNLVTASSPRRPARKRCDCTLPNPLPCFSL